VAYHWQHTRNCWDTYQSQFEVIQVGRVFAPGQALRRTIVSMNALVHNPDADIRDNIVGYGAIFGVEVTVDEPPSIPDFPYEEPNPRDLLHLERAPGQFVTGHNDQIKYIRVPADGTSFTCDTSSQRLYNGEYLSISAWIWWDYLSATVPWSTRYSVVSRCLIETL